MIVSSPIANRLVRSLSALLIALGAVAPLVAADGTSTVTPQVGGGKSGESTPSLHSWELPAIKVQGAGDDYLRENDLIGDYGQPRWTAARMFAEVRTYVIPANQFEFEYWLFVSAPSRHEKDDAKASGSPKPDNEIKQQFEAEMGLGHRLQVDLYQTWVKDGNQGTNTLDATKFEVRYAFADWGKVWGNPTAYAEWEQAGSGPDTAEFKLLLCGDITSHWKWGSNLVWEQKTGGDHSISHEFNNAVSYTVYDEKFSVGAELAIAYVTNLEDNGAGGFTDTTEHHWEVQAGPTIRVHPIPHAHIILTQFVGLNKDAPEARTVLIVGWEL